MLTSKTCFYLSIISFVLFNQVSTRTETIVSVWRVKHWGADRSNSGALTESVSSSWWREANFV
jgi:hypothetical protein